MLVLKILVSNDGDIELMEGCSGDQRVVNKEKVREGKEWRRKKKSGVKIIF